MPPDQTLPDAKRFAAAGDALQAFVDATFVEGLDAKPKRKAESHAQAVDVAEVRPYCKLRLGRHAGTRCHLALK